MTRSMWHSLSILALALTAGGCAPTPAGYADGGTSGGADGSPDPCSPGETRCIGDLYQECEDGRFSDRERCTGGDVCVGALGCAECNPFAERYCVDDAVHACNDDGTDGGFVQQCAFESCSNGSCTDACAAAEAKRSYIGCEYWSVDLDNAVEVPPPLLGNPCSDPSGGGEYRSDLKVCSSLFGPQGLCDYGDSCPAGATCETGTEVCVLDAQGSPFAIVVSNPNPVDPVQVTLEDATGASQTVSVGGGEVRALYPQQLGFADHSIDFSMLGARAYRVTSSAPIVAYQFNPLDNEFVFSNDGSLLIPRHAYDTRYFAITVPSLTRRPQAHDYNGYVTIVAPEATAITVTPTANVRAGAGVPAINAGSTQRFELAAFDVLNLEAVADGDLTGTRIEAEAGRAAFGVFGGHEASVLSDKPLGQGVCCADHLEEQLFPASTWGKQYAIARTKQRQAEPDMLRIVAQTNGTTVTITPAPSGSCATLSAGDFCEVFIAADTVIEANEPIAVAHFVLSSSTEGGGNPMGDPSMAIAVPSEQFRKQYTFLVPAEYDEQYISVVAPAGTSVLLDGVEVGAQLTPFGGGAFAGGRLPVTAGQRKLECPDGCGFEAYGYSGAVSYLFAGGLDLEQIVVD